MDVYHCIMYRSITLIINVTIDERHTRLQSGVDAHVLQERPLSDGSQTGHAPSGHPPQVAEVHVGGEVGRPGRRQDVVEPVSFKTLSK